jgi:transposase
MPQNLIACDRGQTFLMPPDLLDWVPDDHLVWSILGAVEEMDLRAFYGSYRENGQGRAAYQPSTMVALLLYAYARGNRSSRGIERACREDVTYMLITAMTISDHTTIAEFRRRHERALGELFTAVLSLSHEAGLVEVGAVSIDGVKIRANAPTLTEQPVLPPAGLLRLLEDVSDQLLVAAVRATRRERRAMIRAPRAKKRQRGHPTTAG